MIYHYLHAVCNHRFTGFLLFLSAGDEAPASRAHTSATPPNGQTNNHDNLLPPHAPFFDVEAAEKRFHVPATSLLALSTSDDVAGTCKHFPAPSPSAKCYIMTPLHE
jgi:hypothetical protein